ncbi:MAG: MFS transporter [Ruminococcaceae bacterium]|nr:MFS transporter [Oscillospiraceae bacterium]
MKSKNNKKFLSTLIIFSLVGQIAWVVENMYFNVFIYNMFGASPEDISLMVALSAVTATLTTLLIGALSDKVGKRKLFIFGGYILWGISILGFALVRRDVIGALFPTAASVSAICITLAIVLDCVMTFFGSSANDACFNAWLTDVTTKENRGSAEGINAMMPLVAILVVFGGAMLIPLKQTEDNYWTIIFSIIGGAVILIGILGIFLIEEPKIETSENKSYFGNIIYGFRPSVIKKSPMLYVYLLLFTAFGISIQIFMPYLIIYYERGLEMADYVFIMAPAIVLASVFTALWGKVYDKLGFKKSVLPCVVLLALGYIILFIFTHTALVFIGSLLMMCGYLSGMAVFGAVIRDSIPQNKSGMFQGLRIVGQVLIPGVVGPFIGSLILKNARQELINGQLTFIPNENIFFGALIVDIILIVALGLLFFRKEHSKAQNEN